MVIVQAAIFAKYACLTCVSNGINCQNLGLFVMNITEALCMFFACNFSLVALMP